MKTPEVEIRGVRVSMSRRDVRLVSDEEYRDLESLVENEQRYEHGRLVAILVESNDTVGIVRFRATTEHEGSTRGGETELPDRGDTA